jgi:glycosyltransferase involved in cell wall biosynthesis
LFISILIPVYNYDVTQLVKSLLAQMDLLPHSFEIILLDDCSTHDTKNLLKNISTHEHLKIYFNNQNSGRELSRKKLATLASSNNLLFLDCDSSIVSQNFMEQYITALLNDAQIVVGGTIYETNSPQKTSKLLHWKYGSLRESKVNTHTFKANNFCIKKHIFNALPAIKNLQGYGHEDTYWGIWFEQNNHQITFLNNPVLHSGIEDCEAFLQKTNQALKNLHNLSLLVDKKLLAQHVQLYKLFLHIKKARLLAVFDFLNKPFVGLLLKNLKSKNPSINVFNYYKLVNFVKLNLSYKNGL